MPRLMDSVTDAFANLTRIRTEHVGRLLYTENGLPALRLVRFEVTEDGIVVCSAEDWPRRLDDTVVAFEVDRVDYSSETGWTVLVIGRASFDGLTRLTISVDHVSGRRFP